MFAATDAYDRHVGRYGRALGLQLIAAAGVGHTDRALDVGCGTGALTKELVAILGTDRVAAVDPSASFVAACRSRFPGVRVEEAVAESLPFASESFDAALAQLVVNFMTDARAGVGEMIRVTRHGGTVAAAVWDYGGEMTLLRKFWDAAGAVDQSATTKDERNMPFSAPGSLLGLWTEVGLHDAEVKPAVVAAVYDSFDDLWYPFENGVAPSGAYAVSLSTDDRARLRDEYRRRLGVGDRPFELTARAWVVSGRVA